jgi:hypothetical protein
MRSVVNANRDRGKFTKKVSEGSSRRRIVEFQRIIRKDPSFNASSSLGARKGKHRGDGDMIFVTVLKAEWFFRTHRVGFAKTARVEHKVINPRHLVDVTIGAHIGVGIGTVCRGAKLLKGVGNLKSAIANTVNDRLVVGGGRAIENIKVTHPAAHTNMGLIIGINPKDDRGSNFAKL